MRSRISSAGTTLSAAPLALRVERHELDEAHADALVAAEAREVDDLVVVDAAHHDRVDLHRREAGVERGVDARDHTVELVALGQREERGRGRACRATRSRASARRATRSCATSPSFTPFVVSAMSTSSGASMRDEPGDVGADERLAAGEADRLEPEALDADPGDPGDLLVGEELGLREPVHALGRHAVGAAEVAAVGDRDPQILDAARERIDQGNRHPTARHRARLGAGEHGESCGRRLTAGPEGPWQPGVGFALAQRRRSDQLQPTIHSLSGCRVASSHAPATATLWSNPHSRSLFPPARRPA